MVEKGPLTTMKIGSTGMSTSHWYAVVALWFAPGTKEGHGTAQSARTYSFQSRILPTGYKDIAVGTYEQVATSRFMCKDHQKQPDVTRKGLSKCVRGRHDEVGR